MLLRDAYVNGFLRGFLFYIPLWNSMCFRCVVFSRDPWRTDNKINLVELTIWCRPLALKPNQATSIWSGACNLISNELIDQDTCDQFQNWSRHLSTNWLIISIPISDLLIVIEGTTPSSTIVFRVQFENFSFRKTTPYYSNRSVLFLCACTMWTRTIDVWTKYI